MIRVFIDDGAAHIRLFAELVVALITVGAATAAFTGTMTFDRGLILPSGYILKVSTHNAETFNVFAISGDYS
jgi:hypothetical protein